MSSKADSVEVTTIPHIPVRLEWLARREEIALDPDLPIIDGHHHLWDRPDSVYMDRDFLNDIDSGHNIRGSVYVQCRSFYWQCGPEALRPIGEVERVARIATEAQAAGGARICASIVGGADLLLGDAVAPILEAMQARGDGRVHGIRNPLAWHPDPNIRSSPILPPAGLLSNAQFRDGVSWLAKLGLALDVWIYQTQLAELYDLAIAFPQATIVLNHLGGPLYAGRDADLAKEWFSQMRRLACLPNLFVKLGGLGTRVAGYRFHERDLPPSSVELAGAWKPWIMTCIELFGPNRCLFESNFPVDKGMVSYKILWNTFKRLTEAFSSSERSALFSATAANLYRISI